MMNLDIFLNHLGYLFVTSDIERCAIEAAAINFETFSKKNLGSELVIEYKNLIKSCSHEAAIFHLKDKIKYLTNLCKDFTLIPKTSDLLTEMFNKYWEKEQILQLANNILANPDDGKKQIENFVLREALSVRAKNVHDILYDGYNKHMKNIADGKVRIIIPKFKMLSEGIGGFNPQRTMLLLGSTGFGKTNLLLNLAINAIKTLKVVYVNMEMSFQDIYKRLVVIGGGVNYLKYHVGEFDMANIFKTYSDSTEKFYVTDGRRLNLDQIISYAKLQFKNESGILMLDYDQKINFPYLKEIPEWKALQLAQEQLEDLAKELNIYVILAAQLNREGEIAASHRQTYSAHTVLEFKNDEVHGAVIHAKKNRHGEKDIAIKVNYDSTNSVITEREKIILETETKKKRKSLFD